MCTMWYESLKRYLKLLKFIMCVFKSKYKFIFSKNLSRRQHYHETIPDVKVGKFFSEIFR